MNRAFCADCICLVEGESGEWICDELEEKIENVQQCPNEDPDAGCEKCNWTGYLFDYENSVRNWQIEEKLCPHCTEDKI